MVSRGPTTIDSNHMAVGVGIFRVRKKLDGYGNLIGSGRSPQWNVVDHFLHPRTELSVIAVKEL